MESSKRCTEYPYRVVYPTQKFLEERGFWRVAHLPFLMDARPGYARIPNQFLIDLGLGEWSAKTRGLEVASTMPPTKATMHTRADRLIHAFGHDLKTVLSDVSRADEVSKLLEPTKPALAAKITAQLYAAVATQAGADQIKAFELEFLTFLEELGLKESRVAGQLWRFMAGFDAIDRLKRNPYVPACLMDWKPADRIGQRLLRAANEGADLQTHPARLMGALNSIWRDILSEGDTAATEETITTLLEQRGVDPDKALALPKKTAPCGE